MLFRSKNLVDLNIPLNLKLNLEIKNLNESTEVFDKIKPLSKTWIAVDSTKNWVKEFDYAVFPSFFASKTAAIAAIPIRFDVFLFLLYT